MSVCVVGFIICLLLFDCLVVVIVPCFYLVALSCIDHLVVIQGVSIYVKQIPLCLQIHCAMA